jgi:hypothetical protein
MKETYATLTGAINGLRKKGYTTDFNIHQEFLICSQPSMKLSPTDFEIDAVFRFEGDTNPDDQAILYAISSQKFDVKGVLVNGYGISADDETNALVEKLDTHPGPGK